MFSRKTLALVSSLVIVLVALFILSFSAPKSQNQPSTNQSQSTPVAQTVITMSPNPVTFDRTSTGSAQVMMNTSDNEVTAVQLEISYDPDAISNVVIKPGDFFTSPVPLLNTIDKKEGRISYALAIAPAQAPLKGAGTVATIEFSKNPATTLTTTELKLLPRTLVAAKGIGPSVLKVATGTTISFQPTNTP